MAVLRYIELVSESTAELDGLKNIDGDLLPRRAHYCAAHVPVGS